MSDATGDSVDRSSVQALLAVALKRLSERRSQVADQLVVAQQRQMKLVERRDRALRRYRSTPAGIAESLRALETATLRGASPHEIRTLQQLHVAAENESRTEYVQRSDRWGHTPGDGPVRGCPVGSGPLAATVLSDMLFGSYRYDPSAPKVSVRLFVVRGHQRHTISVKVPAAEPIALTYVLASIDPKQLQRVCARLHLNESEYSQRLLHSRSIAG